MHPSGPKGTISGTFGNELRDHVRGIRSVGLPRRLRDRSSRTEPGGSPRVDFDGHGVASRGRFAPRNEPPVGSSYAGSWSSRRVIGHFTRIFAPCRAIFFLALTTMTEPAGWGSVSFMGEGDPGDLPDTVLDPLGPLASRGNCHTVHLVVSQTTESGEGSDFGNGFRARVVHSKM